MSLNVNLQPSVAGGGKYPKWKFSFGGFRADNMGKMGPKTLNI